MKNHRRVQLRVEELEGRLVPSTLTSTNWSGYAVLTGAGAVTSVTGTWTVPTASGSTAAYSATWIGIDGATNSTVEQIGTASDTAAAGTPQYYAWFEMYPGPAYYWPAMIIKPGDQITATVAYVGTAGRSSVFTLSITDLTTEATNPKATYTESVTESIRGAQRSSAEWIVEAPYNGGVLPLADFGTETFTGAQATINKQTGPIDYTWSGATAYPINMITSSGALKDTTSSLSDSGGTSSFSVTWISSGSSSNTSQKSASSNKGTLMQDVAPSIAAPTELSALNNPGSIVNVSVQGTDTVPRISGALAPSTQAVAAFFAGNTVTGGMDAPAGADGLAVGFGETAADTGIQWFAPLPGRGALAPPVIVPAKTEDFLPPAATKTEESAAEPHLTVLKWNGDPGSTREQIPSYSAELPIDQSAAAFVLLGAVLNSRRRTTSADEEAKVQAE